jgi:hypothetical protein
MARLQPRKGPAYPQQNLPVQRRTICFQGRLQMDRVEAVYDKSLRWPDGPGG